MESEWIQVSRSRVCPICGKPDWCLIARNGSAAICPRIEEKSVAYIEGSGWLHKFGGDDGPKPRLRAAPKPLPEHNSVLQDIFRKLRKQTTPEVLSYLSSDLGVSEKSLDLLSVGFSSTRDAFAFPMTRKGKRFLGIRYRHKNGSKFAAKGSKQGLFIPESFTRSRGVVVCEGPTDTAAMLDLGVNAVGRPSCNAGNSLISEMTKSLPVAILSDSDGPGRSGAIQLQKTLKKGGAKSVFVIEPKAGKDAREWVANGATKNDVMETIAEARRAE